MTSKLYEWLRMEFYFSIIVSIGIFEEWVSNITSSQIEGFSEQMYNKE